MEKSKEVDIYFFSSTYMEIIFCKSADDLHLLIFCSIWILLDPAVRQKLSRVKVVLAEENSSKFKIYIMNKEYSYQFR